MCERHLRMDPEESKATQVLARKWFKFAPKVRDLLIFVSIQLIPTYPRCFLVQLLHCQLFVHHSGVVSVRLWDGHLKRHSDLNARLVLKDGVYTIQPVVQRVVQPADVGIHDAAGL